MKKYFLLPVLFLLWTVVCGPWTTADAAVPHLINYQGRVTDTSGNPLTGSFNITFRIYDALTAGNLLWEEIQPGVVVDKGLFGTMLGSVTALNIAFDRPYYLEIKVGNEVMSPRQQITSAGYAMRAEVAESVNGIDPGMVGTKKVDETGLADGMMPYYDNSSGKVKYRTPPAFNLGVWDATKVINTVYRAATDGFVVGYVPSGAVNSVLNFYTDSNNPPLTVRMKQALTNSTNGISFWIPVKKNDYWKLAWTTGGGTVSIFWIPLGS